MQKIYERISALAKEDPKNLEQKTVKLMEETGELASEILKFLGLRPYRSSNEEVILEEVCDVVQTAISLLGMLDISYVDFLESLNSKTDKWEQKYVTKEKTS